MRHKLEYGVGLFQQQDYQHNKALYESIALTHLPGAAMITCVDARIDPSSLTHTAPNELSVERTLGNVPSKAYLEFVIKGKGVKDVVLCGHSDCGAVQGSLYPDTVAHLEHTTQELKATIPNRNALLEGFEQGDEVRYAVLRNLIYQRDKMLGYDFVQEAIRENGLKVHTWYYDIGSGDVLIFDEETQQFIPLTTDAADATVSGHTGASEVVP